MLSTKEELYLYLEKISRGYALKDLKYFTANHISESLNISRNLASQYLNELVKEVWSQGSSSRASVQQEMCCMEGIPCWHTKWEREKHLKWWPQRWKPNDWAYVRNLSLWCQIT